MKRRKRIEFTKKELNSLYGLINETITSMCPDEVADEIELSGSYSGFESMEEARTVEKKLLTLYWRKK
tara:strand:+ start:244 stop:447 length:204 start_codon:yes stop_codon:yes gene_type:complete